MTNKHKAFIFVLFLTVSCSNLSTNILDSSYPTSPSSFTSKTPPITQSPKSTPSITPTPPVEEGKNYACSTKGHTTTWVDDDWLHTYFGSVDGLSEAIGMTITSSENVIEGFFYYIDDTDEMKIKGCLEENRNLTLYVFGLRDDKLLAVIRGEFPFKHPLGLYGGAELQRETIIGTWEDKISQEEFSICLEMGYAVSGTFSNQYKIAGVDDDKVIDNAAQELIRAVAYDEKDAVASLVQFPIWVNIDSEEIKIKDKIEFYEYYGRIFTDEFKERLKQMSPRHMFAKWSGIMLGRGEIWFNASGKVISISHFKGSDISPVTNCLNLLSTPYP